MRKRLLVSLLFVLIYVTAVSPETVEPEASDDVHVNGIVVINASETSVCYYLHNKSYKAKLLHANFSCDADSDGDQKIEILCYGNFNEEGSRNCYTGATCIGFGFYKTNYTTIAVQGENFNWSPSFVEESSFTYNHFTYISEEWSFGRNFYENGGVAIENDRSCPKPKIISASPANGSLEKGRPIAISFDTDINSHCRYSNVSGTDFSLMNDFTARGFTHRLPLDVEDNKIYTYYVRCNSSIGDMADEYYYTFTSEFGPPIVSLFGTLPANATNETLLIAAEFSDVGNGISNNSCLVCISAGECADDEESWYFADLTVLNNTHGECSLEWDTSSFYDGIYAIRVSMNDTANNFGDTPLYKVRVDRTPPNVSLRADVGQSLRIDLRNASNQTDALGMRYKVEDKVGLQKCIVWLDGKLNRTVRAEGHSSEGSLTLFLPAKEPGVYFNNITLECSDGIYTATDGVQFMRMVLGNTSGNSTDLTAVNLSRIENLTFETSTKGKIRFIEDIDLSSVYNIKDYVKIENNQIEINTEFLRTLNKSASLALYNLNFTNPRVLKDGAVCPGTICSNIVYTNGMLTFTVTQFSAYSSEETTGNGDSGGSSGDGGSGSGGGGGGGGSSRRATSIAPAKVTSSEEPLVAEKPKPAQKAVPKKAEPKPETADEEPNLLSGQVVAEVERSSKIYTVAGIAILLGVLGYGFHRRSKKVLLKNPPTQNQ
ncbi:hypothetical protein J4207_06165 [Candidatus Woesearchaeota archaeon]|nr:hypothetical protein [Candidatus Woesearchaeota archaeon]